MRLCSCLMPNLCASTVPCPELWLPNCFALLNRDAPDLTESPPGRELSSEGQYRRLRLLMFRLFAWQIARKPLVLLMKSTRRSVGVMPLQHRRRLISHPYGRARNDLSTANYRGFTLIDAYWRRRPTSIIHCSSACASCQSPPTTSTNFSWCASPALKASCGKASSRRA